MADFSTVFKGGKPVIGMIHLLALPGSPAYAGSISDIEKAAINDLYALEKGGANAAIIENFSDTPYEYPINTAGFAAMCAVAAVVKKKASIPIGINIHFNCAEHEWALAHAIGADFIRVEAFVEHRLGVHGLAYAAAPMLMRMKANLPSNTLIFSDIDAKHTVPLHDQPFEMSVHAAAESGADALIVTGLETGKSPTPDDVEKVKKLSGGLPVILGSGINQDNVAEFFKTADGAIVGSSLKFEGRVENRVDTRRVADFMKVAGGNG